MARSEGRAMNVTTTVTERNEGHDTLRPDDGFASLSAANDSRPMPRRDSFPFGAPTAWIDRPARAATQSARARSCDWVLRFAPAAPAVPDPLMGWIGSRDPLAPLELRFP